MRTRDILGEASAALTGSRSRTCLTGAGVTVGALALVLIVSLSLGLSTLIDDFVSGEEQLRHVLVMPGFGRRIDRSVEIEIAGEMTDAKRDRLRRALMKRSRGGPPMQAAINTIDADVEAKLAAISGVVDARPFVQDRFEAQLGDRSTGNRKVLSIGAPADHPNYPGRLLAGRWFASDDEHAVVVHELMLYELGIASDEAQAAVVGKTLRVTARKEGGGMLAMIMKATGGSSGGGKTQWPVLYSEDLEIVGVIRERFGDDPSTVMDEAMAMQADLFIPTEFHRTLSERRAGQGGLRALLLVADSMDHIDAIEDEVRAMGLQSRSVQRAVSRIKKTLDVATFVAGFLAAIAVFVSCLGIVNTMVMSVLERTREIGLLKALGARSRDVMLLFLVEGAFIGFGGGLLGVAIARGLGVFGNRVGTSMIEEAMQMPFTGTLFQFPLWLLLGGVGFATATSLIASVIPAIRAARIDPVRALRHE